jgi:transposase-like protein
MKAEQEHVLKVDHYERSDEREAYRNGYKDKTVLTRLGKITVQVLQVRGGVPCYPSSLEKGIRSERALKLAIASSTYPRTSLRIDCGTRSLSDL